MNPLARVRSRFYSFRAFIEFYACQMVGCHSVFAHEREWPYKVCTWLEKAIYPSFKTASGRRLYHKDMWALSEEAERGYDFEYERWD